MRDIPRRLGLTGFLLGLLAFLPSARAQGWSPDGSWLAYALTVRPTADWSDWLFGNEDPSTNSTPDPTSYRLWATRVATDESVLLYESAGPLSRPSWSPSGTALAYGHLASGPDQSRRFEVVVQDAPDRRRVLQSWTLDGPTSPPESLDACGLSWSADGRFLAVSGVPSGGLAVLGVADGRIVRELPGGSRPSWAPEGDLLAFVSAGQPAGLELLAMATGQLRRLAEVPGLDQLAAPVWSPEGEALFVIADQPDVRVPSRPVPGGASRTGGFSAPGQPEPSRLRIERVGLDRGDREPVQELQHEPFQDLKDLLWPGFDLSRQGEDFFYSTTVRARRPCWSGSGSRTTRR